MLATTTAAILRLLLRLPDCYVDRYVDLDDVTATCYVYVVHIFVIVVESSSHNEGLSCWSYADIISK
jgi:hypothetical protein